MLMPPGHGKSVYWSQRFPWWYRGNRPKQHLIHVTDGGDLAANNGYKVRNLLGSEPYQRISLEVRLSEDKQGKSDWATNHRGSMPSASVVSRVAERTARSSTIW